MANSSLEAATRGHSNVVSLALSPEQVAGGSTVSATVTIATAAPRGGVEVRLASSSSAIAELSSTSVTVPSGQTTAAFTIRTNPVDSASQVTISASANNTVSATLTVEAPQVSSISLAPAVLTGSQTSTATVTLTSVAAAPGATVTLATNSSYLSFSATATVPSGTTSVTFQVATVAVASTTSATITASSGGSSKSATLTINPPAVTALAFSPATVSADQVATGTVTLNAIAPAGGFPVGLASNSAAVPVPASVVVPAGSTSQSFSVTTDSVAGSVVATVTATTGTTTATGTLAVNAALSLSSVSLAPASVTGGAASSVTASLSSVAPAGGVTVTLSSSDPSVTLPASIVVSAGSATASFVAATSPVSAAKSVVVTATLGSSSATATLTVNPAVVSGLSFSPATLGYGQTSSGTIVLTGNAPSGGLAVSLTSNDPGAVPAPASVAVPAGVATQTFTVTAGSVSSVTSAAITAATGSASVTGSLTVDPALMASPPSVVLASGTLVGVPSSQTVTLSNTSSSGIALDSIAASAEFTQTNTCSATLAAAASCVITLTPVQGGSLTGSVTILSGADSSALTVNLSGTAMHWVALTWMASTTSGVSYNVYRQLQSEGACGTPAASAYTLINSSPISVTYYNDTDPTLMPGDTYCYSVTAVDSGGTSAFAVPPATATLPSP